MYSLKTYWLLAIAVLFAAVATVGCGGVSSPGKSGFHFERANPLGARSDAFQVVKAPAHPVRYGRHSERFEVRPGDCGASDRGGWDDCERDRERTELLETGESDEGSEYWYRWSIYVPKGHVNIWPAKLHYGQFFQAPCKRRPAFMFAEVDGGYWFRVHKHVAGYKELTRLLEAEEFIGKWNDIVVHARWTQKEDGFLKVFVNGELKTEHVGNTLTSNGGQFGNDCTAMKLKYGVYRSFVSRSDKSATVTTIAYFDGIMKSESEKGMFDPLPE